MQITDNKNNTKISLHIKHSSRSFKLVELRYIKKKIMPKNPHQRALILFCY